MVAGVYEKAIDRASAFESLKGQPVARKGQQASQPAPSAAGSTATAGAASTVAQRGVLDELGDLLGGGARRSRASAGEQLIKSAASAVGREVGRQIIRGVLGGIFGSSRR
jgi:hypothetical protein